MKRLFFLLLVSVSFLLSAQNLKLSTKIAGVNVGTNINTKSVLPTSGKTFNLDYKSKESLIKNSTITSNTAIFKGKKYPVYTSNKGKMFIVYPHKDVDTKGYVRKYFTE